MTALDWPVRGAADAIRWAAYEGLEVLRYFKLLIMAPYSPKHNAHLYIHFSYPSNVSDEFLKQFTELVNRYDKYLD